MVPKMKMRDLFDGTPWAKGRRPYRKLAHVADAGCDALRFECARCGWDSDWLRLSLSVTAAKRGIPCPVCNNAREVTVGA